MTMASEVKAAAKAKKLVFGSKSVVKSVKNGGAASVIYASNLPGSVLRDLNHYSNAGGVSIKPFEGNSMELGELLGKPFPVLMLGIKK